jgi:hypothetical protein
MLGLLDHIISLFKSSPYNPYSTLSGWGGLSLRDILQEPPPGSHPALVARRGLLLGSFLQVIWSRFPRAVGGLSVCYRDTVMSGVIETVRNIVTCNDDLTASTEGIECLLIEGMYHNNAGPSEGLGSPSAELCHLLR